MFHLKDVSSFLIIEQCHGTEAKVDQKAVNRKVDLPFAGSCPPTTRSAATARSWTSSSPRTLSPRPRSPVPMAANAPMGTSASEQCSVSIFPVLLRVYGIFYCRYYHPERGPNHLGVAERLLKEKNQRGKPILGESKFL